MAISYWDYTIQSVDISLSVIMLVLSKGAEPDKITSKQVCSYK